MSGKAFAVIVAVIAFSLIASFAFPAVASAAETAAVEESAGFFVELKDGIVEGFNELKQESTTFLSKTITTDTLPTVCLLPSKLPLRR